MSDIVLYFFTVCVMLVILAAYSYRMNKRIDLKRLKQNAAAVKEFTKTKLIAVVKADAYGHGDVICAAALSDIADAFAVAEISEAQRLTGAGIKKDVLVLSEPYDGGDYSSEVVFTAFDQKSFRFLSGKNRRFAVKINTGMNRLGFSESEFLKIKDKIGTYKVHSVFTHIYDKSAALLQTDAFKNITSGLNVPKHIFASNLIYRDGEYFDFVRPGLLLYGYGADFVLPVMSVTAKILQTRRVKKGENVGYGAFPIERDAIIATIDVGYADGFRRKREGEERTVSIGGKRRRVVGQVCMDTCMIETDESVSPGDDAIILGDDLTADELAAEWHTVSYDVLTSLGHSRAKTEYVN